MVVSNKIKCLLSGKSFKKWKDCAFDKSKDSSSIKNAKKRKLQTLAFQKFKAMHYDDYFENLVVMNDFLRKYNLSKLTQKLKEHREKVMSQRYISKT